MCSLMADCGKWWEQGRGCWRKAHDVDIFSLLLKLARVADILEELITCVCFPSGPPRRLCRVGVMSCLRCT